MPPPLLVTFAAGASGPWRIERMEAVIGEGLPPAERLAVIEGQNPSGAMPAAPAWTLRGTTSNTRYTNRAEVDALAAKQEGLGRPQATCAALIPIRKSEAWWALAQDERRAIVEERSRHIAVGLEYLPAVARRLHPANWASRSTSLPGSNMRPPTPPHSMNWSAGCVPARSGAMWSARSISG